MPCLIRLLTSAGLQEAPWSGDTLADTAPYEPRDGVYTITNTYDRTKVLKWSEHLDRLEDSARRADIALRLDRGQLRANLRAMILEVDWGDVRFRITVGKQQPDTLILSLEPFKPLAATVFETGVRAITAPDSARHNPQAKTTDWAIQRQGLQAAMPAGIYETFLRDASDHLLEGLGSNFYAVLDDTLYTADEGVLKGISQQIVLAVAPTVLPVRMQPILMRQLAGLQEAFLSSSSRGIVPVVEIDGIRIGTGRVGEHTQALRRAYSAWLELHLEEL